MTGNEPESTINRRRLLIASGAVVAAGAAGSAGAFLPRPRRAQAAEPVVPAAAPRPAPHATTTLETTARLGGAPHTGTYRRLESGPGWPVVVRQDIAPSRAGRADRRTPLACFVQFTDLHIADVQNPLRTEFLRSHTPTAWRAQEALTVAGAVALVEKVNALGDGPHSGLPPAFVMTTGDNVDNNSAIELEWFLTVMNGGRITPAPGTRRRTKASRTPDSRCTGTRATRRCAMSTNGAGCR